MALRLVSEEQRERLSADEYNELQQNYWLLRTGRGSDCAATCDGVTLRLHRDIICERSGFFKASFEGGFMEGASQTLNLGNYVGLGYLFMILMFIYTSFPEAGYDMAVYMDWSDSVHLYTHLFELYRQADYLRVPSLTKAISAELKKRLEQSARDVFRLQHRSADPAFKKAFEDTMEAVVYAYDDSNEYYVVYEPVRAELFCWIKMCYPVLSRLGDDFYSYLVRAPQLMVTILKMNQNIETSSFIDPDPEACCMFCGNSVGQGRASRTDYAQPKFGVVADRSGGVKYFCGRYACFRQIRVSRCFNGTHQCVGLFCVCGRWNF